MDLTWIESAGGPLLLLPRGLLSAWSGIKSGALGGRTDYERACEVSEYVDRLAVGHGEGLVLGDMPMPTAWAPADLARPGEGLLVRWMHADDNASVLDHLRNLPGDIWAPDEVLFRTADEPLYLFDSAIPGQELRDSDYITATLLSGTYRVATAYFEPDDRTALVLHLFHRNSG